jgi:5'-methylthioadenosine phosphorylase
MHVRGAALDRRLENAMKQFHDPSLPKPPASASRENAGGSSRPNAIKSAMSKHRIGIIGGTGLYGIEGFTNQKWVKVKTPFGPPSDDLLTGKLAGRDVVFLPRHGRGHKILPSELNHRANIWAMKKLGVQWIISVSAVGSLQEKYKPCDIVVIDQFLDRTKQSANHTFFGRGIVAHVSFARPICEELRQILLKVGRDELLESQKSAGNSKRDSQSSSLRNVTIHDGGTYVNMEGPAFSTRAESLTNHRAGYDVIGMTNLGEAKCAREAEIAYATLAMSTDYDCWKEDEHVTLEMIIANLHRNADTAKKIVAAAISKIPAEPTWPCHSALKYAILTDKKFWPKKTVTALKPILAKYL